MGGTTGGPFQQQQQQDTGFSSFNGTNNQQFQNQSQSLLNTISNAINQSLGSQYSQNLGTNLGRTSSQNLSQANTAQTTGGTTTNQINPYAPAQGTLNSILAQLQGINPAISPTQTAALTALTNLGQQGDPFAGQNAALANSLYAGLPDQSGTINSAYQNYINQLNPTASGANLDPTQNGALQKYLDIARQDATNNINGLFAGSGRDLSGAHIQALGRGISQAEAPILYDAYNQGLARQAAAQNNLYSAGNTTAGLLSQLAQANVASKLNAPNIAQAANASGQYGPLLQLQAASQMTGIPLQNLGLLSGIASPLAQTFGTTTGTQAGTQTGTQFGQQLGQETQQQLSQQIAQQIMQQIAQQQATQNVTGLQSNSGTSNAQTSGSGYNIGNRFGQSQTQIPTWQAVGGGILGGLGLLGSFL